MSSKESSKSSDDDDEPFFLPVLLGLLVLPPAHLSLVGTSLVTIPHVVFSSYDTNASSFRTLPFFKRHTLSAWVKCVHFEGKSWAQLLAHSLALTRFITLSSSVKKSHELAAMLALLSPKDFQAESIETKITWTS